MFLDQLVKLLTEGTQFTLIPRVLAVHPVRNRGFSLGLFPDSALPALIVSLAVFVLLLYLSAKLREPPLLKTAVTLILAGAFSNILDRVFLGCVRDMLELLFIDFYVFNPADICVTGGAALAVFALLKDKPGGTRDGRSTAN